MSPLQIFIYRHLSISFLISAFQAIFHLLRFISPAPQFTERSQQSLPNLSTLSLHSLCFVIELLF
jgi:hypothetical protein